MNKLYALVTVVGLAATGCESDRPAMPLSPTEAKSRIQTERCSTLLARMNAAENAVAAFRRQECTPRGLDYTLDPPILGGDYLKCPSSLEQDRLLILRGKARIAYWDAGCR